ncbi:hypothetical protein PG999_012213 [Apiospora kogelbergensis]|uniref:Heterokaryon incompatibility domain-containing protein n=1 Tax=Apiospora kogelbergensis TaxID=1337665 RepID=A0AAW0QRL3_9PEZI
MALPSGFQEWRSRVYQQGQLSFDRDFRLLTIKPPDATATVPGLHCILKHTNLNKSPSFYTVSHACSTQGDYRVVYINGVKVPVSNEIVLALQHVQHKDKNVTIWIDALCVNTANLEETSAQMSLLPDIFTASRRTLVWLGAADHGSDAAMEALSRIYVESQQQTVHLPTGSWDNTFSSTPKMALSKLLPQLKTSFTSLLERRYWSRSWSLQELAYSAKCGIACGQQEMDSSRFFKAAISLDRLTNDSTISKWLASGEANTAPSAGDGLEGMAPSSFSRLPAVKILVERNRYRNNMSALRPAKRPLWTVLQRHLVHPVDTNSALWMGEDNDPRDAIRGLMGLATDLEDLGLALDYERDYKSLCLDVSAVLLKRRADPLRLCNSPSSIPSWVIHWKKARRSPLHLAHNKPFAACGPADERFYKAEVNPLGQLVLRAGFVDKVKILRLFLLKGNSKQDQQRSFLKNIKLLWSKSLGLKTSPYKGEMTLETLARIPVADLQVDAASGAGEAIVSLYEDALEELSQTGSEDSDETIRPPSTYPSAASSAPTNPQRISDSIDYLAAVDRMVGWCPFMTDIRYLGLASSKLACDDVIVIPYGSSVPFAVRRVDDEDYRLMGEVYLHGVMDGEFMKSNREEIVIRLD